MAAEPGAGAVDSAGVRVEIGGAPQQQGLGGLATASSQPAADEAPESSRARAGSSAASNAIESTDFDLHESRQYVEHVAEIVAERLGRRKLNAGLRWVLLIVVGACTGLVAVGVDTGVNRAYRLREQLVESLSGGGVLLQYIAYVATSLAFASVAGFLVCFVEPFAAGSGIPEVKCHLNGVHIPHLLDLRTLVVKASGVMFSVASGLPCGKEGPMIHSGACIAHVLSGAFAERLLRPLRPDIEARDLVAAGASCGVAAAFGAPLGGVLFAIEEGASFFDPDVMLRCFVCCAAATLTTHFFISGVNGWEAWGRMGVDGGAPASFGRFDDSGYRIWELAVFALMGGGGGLLGAGFNAASSRVQRWRSQNIPKRGPRRFVEVLLVCFVVSSIAFVVPAVSSKESATSELYRSPGTESLRSLFHEQGAFDKGGLLLFALLYYTLACWTYGIGVPSGLFVPSLLAGAAFGRLTGEILAKPFGMKNDVEGTSDAGIYALVGATALLAGNARITISLAAILIEASGSTLWAVPIFVTVMCAKWAGDMFNEGVYHIQIHLSKFPILEGSPEQETIVVYARDVMRESPITFAVVERVRNVLETMEGCSHHGFPVIDDSGHFVGLVKRATLLQILEKGRAYHVFQEPSGDLAHPAPTFPYRGDRHARPLSEVRAFVTPMDLDMMVDLSPFTNQGCHTVPEHASIMRVHMLFRATGLRHLPVVGHDGVCTGIITRKDLLRASHEPELLLESAGGLAAARAEKRQFKASLLGKPTAD